MRDALLTRTGTLASGGLLLATLIALVGVASLGRYEVTVAFSLAIFMTLAQAWNIVGGFSGSISLGVGALVGVGGYTAGLLMIHRGLEAVPAIVAGALVAAFVGALLSVPLLRMRGFYFAVGTLAATLTLQALVVNWAFAGGSSGITVPINRVPDDLALLRLAIVLVALSTAVAVFLRFSSFGLAVVAVRDNEAAATGLGLAAFRYRFVTFVVSCGLMGAAGALLGIQQASFEPDGMFGISWTLNAVLMTTVGGIGTVLGPLAGALIVDYGLTQQLESYQTLSLVIEGVLLVAIVRFAPGGVVPLAGRSLRRLARRRRPAFAPDAIGTARG